MERKNYLEEELSKEEKAYLKTLVRNKVNEYLRNNYQELKADKVEYNDSNVFNITMNMVEPFDVEEGYSAVEFEKVASDRKLYSLIKALSKKEKTVLFLLYKKEKGINEIADELNLSRETIWRIKNRAINKIMKEFIGGSENV